MFNKMIHMPMHKHNKLIINNINNNKMKNKNKKNKSRNKIHGKEKVIHYDYFYILIKY